MSDLLTIYPALCERGTVRPAVGEGSCLLYCGGEHGRLISPIEAKKVGLVFPLVTLHHPTLLPDLCTLSWVARLWQLPLGSVRGPLLFLDTEDQHCLPFLGKHKVGGGGRTQGPQKADSTQLNVTINHHNLQASLAIMKTFTIYIASGSPYASQV